jgi:hypothetical protein
MFLVWITYTIIRLKNTDLATWYGLILPTDIILEHRLELNLEARCWQEKINFNIITPSMPRSLEWPVPFSFSNKNFVFVCLLTHVCYMSCSSHSLSFDYPNILRGIQIIKLLIVQPTGGTLLGTLILVSTVFSNNNLIHWQLNGILLLYKAFV